MKISSFICNNDGLPVSVVIPHQRSRDDFFERYCLPAVVANDPREIVVVENDGEKRTGAPYRNYGFEKSTEDLVFFCDDDVILSGSCLDKLLGKILGSWQDPGIGYCYCGYTGIVIPPGKHPQGPTFTYIPTVPDDNTVRRGSVISANSLFRRDRFRPFDETLLKYDDWDLFITLLEGGIRGVCVPESLFLAFYMDLGVSETTDYDWVFEIRKRHGLYA